MKKFSALLTAAVLGLMGVSGAVVEAGNYQPTSKSQFSVQNSPEITAKPGDGKTAFFYDPIYGGYGGSFCSPVVRCNSYCSPCGPRPYFPAVGNYGYGGFGGYSNYGMGGYGGYGYGSYYGGGLGGYGSPVMPYSAPVINSPVVNPYLSNPGFYPTGLNGGYGANIAPISQPGLVGPVINTPVYTDPVLNSPFYP